MPETKARAMLNAMPASISKPEERALSRYGSLFPPMQGTMPIIKLAKMLQRQNAPVIKTHKCQLEHITRRRTC
jgi:hypothetical protein